MKKSVFIALVMTISLLFNLQIVAAEELVDIPDSAFKRALLGKLGKDEHSNISQEELALIKEFIYAGTIDGPIESLEGAQHMVNLEKLYLVNNDITDLTPLASMTKLTELVIQNASELKNLSGIEGLVNLTKIDLERSAVNNLTALSNLVNLEVLRVDKVPADENYADPITNLEPLRNLKNLKDLNLTGNKITDISPLEEMSNLEILSLQWNRVADVSPLNSIVNAHPDDGNYYVNEQSILFKVQPNTIKEINEEEDWVVIDNPLIDINGNLIFIDFSQNAAIADHIEYINNNSQLKFSQASSLNGSGWKHPWTEYNMKTNNLEFNGSVLIGFANFDRFLVSYEFLSADGQPLPVEVLQLLPENYKEFNGSTVSVENTFVDIVVKDGCWVFRGWNQVEQTINKADIKFTGVWEFDSIEEETPVEPDEISEPENVEEATKPATLEVTQDLLSLETIKQIEPTNPDSSKPPIISELPKTGGHNNFPLIMTSIGSLLLGGIFIAINFKK